MTTCEIFNLMGESISNIFKPDKVKIKEWEIKYNAQRYLIGMASENLKIGDTCKLDRYTSKITKLKKEDLKI